MESAVSRLIQDEDGWQALACLYMEPKHRSALQEKTKQSTGFQLRARESRRPLCAAGAARQLVEESRSIFVSNLTNPVAAAAIARQFFEKADEDNDGKVSRAELRRWTESMLTADAYAGLDPEEEAADVMSCALGTTAGYERSISRALARALRRRSRGLARAGDGPLLGAPAESWVQKGRSLEERPRAEAGNGCEAADSDVDTTGTLTPSSCSSEDEAVAVDPHAPVSFEEFKRAVDAVSLKALLRTDAVRHEIPTREEPPAQPYKTLAFEGSLDEWERSVAGCRAFAEGKGSAWERAYASGENCIWVLPEPDHDVQRVLAEGWFQTEGLCLELGCGLGYDSLAFAEAGFEVVGVDVSATAIKAARAMARSRGMEEHVRFLCGDAYELPTPPSPVALVWDNTLYQNAQRADKYGGGKGKISSRRYKEMLLRLTEPGSLVLMNVMSSELTEKHLQLAEQGFSLPLTSALRAAMEFVEHFELLLFRNGVYDLNSLFIRKASEVGYEKPEQLGGLPSWCLLMRRRPEPRPFSPVLPREEAFSVASRILSRDGFQRPPQPLFLRRLVEEEWGEDWGEGPKSSLALAPPEEAKGRAAVLEEEWELVN